MALQPVMPSLNLAGSAFQLKLPQLWRVSLPLLGMSSLSVPLLDRLPKPSSILQDIWDGLLKAVPKKKTSHSRSRSRRLAGKGLKDVLAVVKCPSCGRPKRAHYLCPYCVYAVQLYWKRAWDKLGLETMTKGKEATTELEEFEKAESQLQSEIETKEAKRESASTSSS